MLRQLAVALGLVCGVSSVALADHDADPRTVAYHAWYLADDAETLAHQASHLDYQIAQAAQRLHIEASDVYHVANGFEKDATPEDHDHTMLMQREFNEAAQAYQQLGWLMDREPTRDHTLDAYWHRIETDYSNLYWAVYGYNE